MPTIASMMKISLSNKQAAQQGFHALTEQLESSTTAALLTRRATARGLNDADAAGAGLVVPHGGGGDVLAGARRATSLPPHLSAPPSPAPSLHLDSNVSVHEIREGMARRTVELLDRKHRYGYAF